MRRQIFVTRRAAEISRWRQAFLDAEVIDLTLMDTLSVADSEEAVFWLHLAETDQDYARALVQDATKVANGCPLVVLSNQPSQNQGLICLECGASGYSNALSNPEVLQQVALVVENGGIWMGPELLVRFRDVMSRLPNRLNPVAENKLAGLSPRERQVALAVAAGASNKEVAREMGITERTIKAHLSSVFERLRVRDRVQLALKLNSTAEPGGASDLN